MIAPSSSLIAHTQVTAHTTPGLFRGRGDLRLWSVSSEESHFPLGHMEIIMLQPHAWIFNKRPCSEAATGSEVTSCLYSTFHELPTSQTCTISDLLIEIICIKRCEWKNVLLAPSFICWCDCLFLLYVHRCISASVLLLVAILRTSG